MSIFLSVHISVVEVHKSQFFGQESKKNNDPNTANSVAVCTAATFVVHNNLPLLSSWQRMTQDFEQG